MKYIINEIFNIFIGLLVIGLIAMVLHISVHQK